MVKSQKIGSHRRPSFQLSMLRVFLLSNLLQIIYILVETMTKTVLISQDTVSAFELAFFRSAYNLAASTFYLQFTGAQLSDGFGSTTRWVLLMRCMSGTICFTMFVFAIKYLPLSIFFVLMNASPFLVALLACFWLHERLSLVEVFCMLGAFGGILLVGLSKRIDDDDEAESVSEDGFYQVGLFCALLACLGQAVTVTSTRRLQGMSVIVIQWYYAFISTLTTGFGVLFQEKPFIVAFRDTSW